MAIADIKDIEGDGNSDGTSPEPDTSDTDNTSEDNTNTQDEETDDDTLQTSDQPDGDSETQPDEQPDTDAPSDDSQSTDDQNNQAQDADDLDQEQPDETGDAGDVDLSEVSLPDNVDDPSNLSTSQKAKYYKEKFGNSTAEAQRLAEKLEDATSFNTEDVPDDEELVEEYPNFHDLPQDRQDTIRRVVAQERQVNRMLNAVQDVTQETSRMNEAKEFAEDKDVLNGHEEDFAAYAAENGNESTDLDILAKAYQHEVSGNSSEPDQSSASKDPALNTGGSSQAGSTESESDTITTERAQELRDNNPKKYQEEVVQGDKKIVEG